eukprot:scaffold46343_cov22-Phaeocystis_antarctica.AAC.1
MVRGLGMGGCRVTARGTGVARYMSTSAAEARMAETLVCTLMSRPEWREGGRASRASPKRDENLVGVG